MTELSTFAPQSQPPLFNIALTGHPGSGKSTILRILQLLKIQTIDIDKIVKALYKETYLQELINTQILHQPKNRPLNNLELKRFIKHDPNKLKYLERTVHPYILEILLAKMKALQLVSLQCIVVEVPLLFEVGWHIYFDHVVVVKPDQTRQYSILKARGWSHDYIDFIMKRFYPYSLYTKKNFLIENRYDTTELILQLRFIMDQIQNYA